MSMFPPYTPPPLPQPSMAACNLGLTCPFWNLCLNINSFPPCNNPEVQHLLGLYSAVDFQHIITHVWAGDQLPPLPNFPGGVFPIACFNNGSFLESPMVPGSNAGSVFQDYDDHQLDPEPGSDFGIYSPSPLQKFQHPNFINQDHGHQHNQGARSEFGGYSPSPLQNIHHPNIIIQDRGAETPIPGNLRPETPVNCFIPPPDQSGPLGLPDDSYTIPHDPLKLSYKKFFAPSGHHLEVDIAPFNPLQLRYSRGIFFKSIPQGATLASITEMLRGGGIERIDFHPLAPRGSTLTAGIYFIRAEDAFKYLAAARIILGPNSILQIPREKGGCELIKLNVGQGISWEGATRGIRVSNLPSGWTLKELEEVIKRQSKGVRVEIEKILILCGKEGSGGKNSEVEIWMASIGTALGTRLQMRREDRWRSCRFAWVRDPCEGDIEEVAFKWKEMLKELDRRKWELAKQL